MNTIYGPLFQDDEMLLFDICFLFVLVVYIFQVNNFSVM